jgi:hypothetical protein
LFEHVSETPSDRIVTTFNVTLTLPCHTQLTGDCFGNRWLLCKMPADASTGFIKPRWPKLVITNTGFD